MLAVAKCPVGQSATWRWEIGLGIKIEKNKGLFNRAKSLLRKRNSKKCGADGPKIPTVFFPQWENQVL